MKKASILVGPWLLLLIAFSIVDPIRGQEATPFTQLFDTGAGSAEPLAEAVVGKRPGWTLVPEDKLDHKFSGDAVLLNDKLTVVLRAKGTGPEVFSKSASGWKQRASLGRMETLSGPASSLGDLKIIENSTSALMVEAGFAGTAPAAMRFRLTTGEAILEIRPGAQVGFLGATTKSRLVVVPDYFGDDMVFDAPTAWPAGQKAPGGTAKGNVCLPAENLLLNLIDGGDAILMSAWSSSEQDAWLAEGHDPWLADAAAGKPGALCANRFRCAQGRSIWLAFLECPGLWHLGSAAPGNSWKPPFAAKWRCGFVRADSVADSWMTERPEGLDTAKRSQARAPGSSRLVYPMDRSAATPLTATCPTDVMRNTLGVGPCQYILACEGMSAQGDPTPNAVMNWVEKQFEQKKARKVADDIQERLGVMVEHMDLARARIQGYAAFSSQIRRLLATKPAADSFLPVVDEMDQFVSAALAPSISAERAKQLAGEVIALIGQENALGACQRLGEELRALGALQDGALARCRMAVRRLWAQSKTAVANAAAGSDLAQQIQAAAEQKLKEKPAKEGKNGTAKP